jgi:hypothetical protein
MERVFIKKSDRKIWHKKMRCLLLKRKDVVNKNNAKPQINTPCSKLSNNRFCFGAHTALVNLKTCANLHS